MIRLTNVEKTYDNGTHALNGISFEIQDGEFVFLVGPSGSGKSTIIKLLTGELVPSRGRVMINGFSMSNITQRQIPLMRRTIGVIFQDFRLIGNKTVYDNLSLAMRAVGASAREIKTRIPYVLGLVGLDGKGRRFPDELSGGEQQRVAIARALVNNPSTIVADEPEDVEDITSICGGLNINIGTLNQRSIQAMFRAGEKAASLGHVLLLDPVGAGASALRTNTAVELMERLPFTVIRGNISEIKTLALGSGKTRGVDADVSDAVSDGNLDAAVAFVKDFARRSHAIVAVTGAIDLVSDADRCFVIRNGRPEMGKITGTGCQLSGMMTAFVAANPDRRLEAAAAAVCAMGLAGEIGWSRMAQGDGNSTYRNRIIDAIYNMDGAALDKGAKYAVR